MVNYSEAFKRPFQNFGKLLLGLVFSFIPIVNFIATGYGLECARTASKKKFKLPEWENFGKLFVDGLLAVLITLIYFMIPAVLAGIAFIMIIVKMGLFNLANKIDITAIDYVNPAIINMIMPYIVLLIIAGLLFIFAFYISYMGLMEFAINKKFSKAFDFRKILRKAFTGKYFSVFFITMVYSAIVLLALFLVSTYIPIIPVIFASWMLTITIYTLFGELYSELK